jgi:uncharacterized protein YndB with AHSA1/START domain
MDERDPERAIRFEVIVDAGIQAVWDAWTTEAGVCTFFAARARVDPRPDGAYEILFNLDAPAGEQGGEGMTFLALDPPHMLSFTWNAPPTQPAIRRQRTHVTVRLLDLGDGRTRVRLNHAGWGEGPLWDETFDYFTRAWGKTVLPRLRWRFANGPVDWEHRVDWGPPARPLE